MPVDERPKLQSSEDYTTRAINAATCQFAQHQERPWAHCQRAQVNPPCPWKIWKMEQVIASCCNALLWAHREASVILERRLWKGDAADRSLSLGTVCHDSNQLLEPERVLIPVDHVRDSSLPDFSLPGQHPKPDRQARLSRAQSCPGEDSRVSHQTDMQPPDSVRYLQEGHKPERIRNLCHFLLFGCLE